MASCIITAGAGRPRRNRPCKYRMPKTARAMLTELAPGRKGAVVTLKDGTPLTPSLYDPQEVRRQAAKAVAAHGRLALELVVWEVV